MSRLILWVMNVKVVCPDKEKIRRLDGLLFPNHISYLDIFVMEAVTPTRFLAKDAIRTWPVVGQAATGIGCVYVKRGDKGSRHQAREAIANADTFPPVTLFPEGKRGPGDMLLPFRYGAFDIAASTTTPYLPCAIVYDQLDYAIWRRGTNVWKAVWHLASRSGKMHATVIPLNVNEPAPTDDAEQLAKTAHAELNALLTEMQYQLIKQS
ncbi:MAG: 1-acyl-sn-glycerol-3-phosphate acyltransferase [Chloroflexi bacterium]|nr:1-acyl-sn-glycerol-3-phosphate acyltransferase [Chloroflexota bacterium]